MNFSVKWMNFVSGNVKIRYSLLLFLQTELVSLSCRALRVHSLTLFSSCYLSCLYSQFLKSIRDGFVGSSVLNILFITSALYVGLFSHLTWLPFGLQEIINRYATPGLNSRSSIVRSRSFKIGVTFPIDEISGLFFF